MFCPIPKPPNSSWPDWYELRRTEVIMPPPTLYETEVLCQFSIENALEDVCHPVRWPDALHCSSLRSFGREHPATNEGVANERLTTRM